MYYDKRHQFWLTINDIMVQSKYTLLMTEFFLQKAVQDRQASCTATTCTSVLISLFSPVCLKSLHWLMPCISLKPMKCFSIEKCYYVKQFLMPHLFFQHMIYHKGKWHDKWLTCVIWKDFFNLYENVENWYNGKYELHWLQLPQWDSHQAQMSG